MERWPDDPRLPEAKALAERCEAVLGEGQPSLRRALALLLPNNLRSLAMSLLSFALFLMPTVSLSPVETAQSTAERLDGQPIQTGVQLRGGLNLTF